MAKIFRINRYVVQNLDVERIDTFTDRLLEDKYVSDVFQQVHIEESEEFELDRDKYPDSEQKYRFELVEE